MVANLNVLRSRGVSPMVTLDAGEVNGNGLDRLVASLLGTELLYTLTVLPVVADSNLLTYLHRPRSSPLRHRNTANVLVESIEETSIWVVLAGISAGDGSRICSNSGQMHPG